MLHTTDGGASWTNQVANIADQFPRGEWGWKLQRLNDRTMFVALENFTAGAILRTDDNGHTWQRLEVNDQQQNVDLEVIGFLDSGRGRVGGWGPRSNGRPTGVSSATADGGRNWSNSTDAGQYLNRFRFVGDPVQAAYASGTTIYKFTYEPVPAIAAALDEAPSAPEELSSATKVAFEISVPKGTALLELRVFGKFGETIATLLSEQNPQPGTRVYTWDFADQTDNKLPPGLYVLRITTDDDSTSLLVVRTPQE